MDYFAARVERMDYAAFKEAGIVIGSGVAESVCKGIYRQRLGGPVSKGAILMRMCLRYAAFSSATASGYTLWNHLSPSATSSMTNSLTIILRPHSMMPASVCKCEEILFPQQNRL